MGSVPTPIILNSTTPAAPTGFRNDKPQTDNGNPQRVSFYTPQVTGINVQTGTSYTIAAADNGLLVTFSAATAIAVTLPTRATLIAVNADLGSFRVLLAAIGAGTVTVTPSGGVTIDGAATITLAAAGREIRLNSDGNWYTVPGGGIGSKHGNAAYVQMSDNTGASGNYAKYDANGNVTDSGVPAPSGVGAIAIAFTSPAGTVNLSTLGTRDWFALGAAATPRLLETITTTQVSLHHKALGDSQMMLDFDWVWAGNASGSIGTGSTMGYTLATTATDDTATAALSSNSFNTNMGKGASATGFGFSIRVPADTFSRVLYIFGGPLIVGASGTVTAQVTAHLSDGSHADVTDSQSATGSGASNIGRWAITYNGSRDGQTLVVTVLITANSASSTGKVVFAAAALA